jgi:hypothetical protein
VPTRWKKCAHEGNATEPVDMLTADRIYERRWALIVLDQALAD